MSTRLWKDDNFVARNLLGYFAAHTVRACERACYSACVRANRSLHLGVPPSTPHSLPKHTQREPSIPGNTSRSTRASHSPLPPPPVRFLKTLEARARGLPRYHKNICESKLSIKYFPVRRNTQTQLLLYIIPHISLPGHADILLPGQSNAAARFRARGRIITDRQRWPVSMPVVRARA